MTNALTVRSATQRGPGEQRGVKNTTGSLPPRCEFFVCGPIGLRTAARAAVHKTHGAPGERSAGGAQGGLSWTTSDRALRGVQV